MFEIIITAVILTCSAICVLFLDTRFVLIDYVQEIIIATIFYLLTVWGLYKVEIGRRFLHGIGKWVLLGSSASIVLLLIISTGGIFSPLFILLYIYILLIGFVFDFKISMIFVLFSVVVLVFGLFTHTYMWELLIEDPGVSILLVASFVTILPISYIFSHKYHGKDSLFKVLNKEISVEDSIISTLSELVFITDQGFKIISINDVVEEVLHKSRVEVVNKPLFDILYIKTKDGSLVTQKSITDLQNGQDSFYSILNASLIALDGTTRKVNVLVRPIMDLEGKLSQLSFIVSNATQPGKNKQTDFLFEGVRAKHNAALEDLKQRLHGPGLEHLQRRLLVVAKSEEDLLLLAALQSNSLPDKTSRIDTAELIKEIVTREQEYASTFTKSVTFSLAQMPETESSHKPFSTGRYFTIQCNIGLFEMLIEKIIDVAILISVPGEVEISVKVERLDEGIQISVRSNTAKITDENKDLLFQEQYGSLFESTNLRFGSGVEGYIAQKIAENLGLSLTVSVESSSLTVFKLHIPHNLQR